MGVRVSFIGIDVLVYTTGIDVLVEFRVERAGLMVWGVTELARRTVRHRAQKVDRRRLGPPRSVLHTLV